MSINLSVGHTKGSSNLRSIDFDINPNFSQSDFKGETNAYCGELKIRDQVFKLKHHELERIIDTLTSAKDVLYKKHKLGIMIG